MDRLQAMRVFVQVVERGGFAAAARMLDLSPAVVTRQIAELEAHLGARLLHRTTRRIALTDTGELYLERVRHILAELEDTEAQVGSAAREPRGHLRLQVSPAFAVHQLAKHLPAFRERHPQVSLELTIEGPVEGVDPRHDLSLITVAGELTEGQFVARRLARWGVMLCAAPGYLRRHGVPQSPDELRHHEMLLPVFASEFGFRHPDQPDEVLTLVPQRRGLSTNHFDTLYAAALAGCGITGLPSYVAENALREGRLVRLLAPWHMLTGTLYAAVPTRRHLPARTSVMLEFLQQTWGCSGDRDPWEPPAAPDQTSSATP